MIAGVLRFRDFRFTRGGVSETTPVTFTSIETIVGGLGGCDVRQAPALVTIRAAAVELHFHHGIRCGMDYWGSWTEGS